MISPVQLMTPFAHAQGKSSPRTAVQLQPAVRSSQAPSTQPWAAVNSRPLFRGAGRPLDPAARARFEGLMGQELSRVRVHDDSAASESTRVLRARAYALGDDIVFGAGEYRPHTRSGERLLMHELAHVVHARAAPGGPRPGIGPADTPAERGAEAFANATAELRPVPLAQEARSSGPAWQLQLDRVSKRGRIEDAAVINYGPGDGDVIDVRSGVETEPDDGSHLDPNQFSLEVEGPDAPQMHWLQFIWVELFATMPTGRLQLAGPLPSNTDKNQVLTEKPTSPIWSLDSASASSPYYEAGGASTRTPTDLTMFDWPGMNGADAVGDWVKIRPAGTPHTLVMHLDTYLIQGTRAVYNVQWTSTTTYTMDKNKVVSAVGPRAYHVVGSGRVDALPANLRKLLAAKYSAYARVGEPPPKRSAARRRPPRVPRQPFFR